MQMHSHTACTAAQHAFTSPGKQHVQHVCQAQSTYKVSRLPQPPWQVRSFGAHLQGMQMHGTAGLTKAVCVSTVETHESTVW